MRIAYAIYTLLMLGLYSCSIERHMPAGEKLYGGNRIILQKTSEVSSSDAIYAKQKIKGLVSRKKNSTILSFPLRANIYYGLGDSAHDTRIRRWLRQNFAQVPVTDQSIHTDITAAILQNMLQYEGFFQSTVTGDTLHKGYKTIERYNIQLAPRYHLKTISFNTDATPLRKQLDSLVHTPGSYLQPRAPYRLDDFKAEGSRLSFEMKKRGYYYMDESLFTSIVDTFPGNRQTDLIVDLMQPLPEKAQKPYYIHRISIYPNYTISNLDTKDTLAPQSSGDNLLIHDPQHTFRPDMFNRLISYRPGDLYNVEEIERTFNRLYGTGAFKFATSRISEDTAGLRVRYYLTPLPKQSIQLETGGNTKSNNAFGVQLATTWSNRNTFRRGEVLYLRLDGGIDLQYANSKNSSYNYKAGIETGISFPRFIIPFFNREFNNTYNVRTLISTGYDMLIRSSLYNIHAYKLNYSYAWKTNVHTDYIFTPLGINYLQHFNIKEDDLAAPDNRSYRNVLKALLSNELIIGPQFNYGYNNMTGAGQRQHFAFNGNLELSGNILGLIKQPGRGGDSLRKKVLGIPFAEYTKIDLDFRYYHQLGPRVQWASRIFAGIGLPYGNSSFLPLIKQYQAGGSNGIRAFRQQTIGPGAFYIPDTLSAELKDFFRNTPQAGDLKLDLNTELRFPITKLLQGAVFVDAGNVWAKKNTFIYDLAEKVFDSTRTSFTNKKFSGTFYKELAVGGGIGLRLDFTFVVIRIDLALPFRKPWLPEGERWVFNKIDLLNPEWRKENLVLNFGIGYPF